MENVPMDVQVKSRDKTRQVPENWSQQLEHVKVPKKGRNNLFRRVSVLCWHATPVANAPLKIQRKDLHHFVTIKITNIDYAFVKGLHPHL